MEGCVFILGHLFHLTVEFAGGCLIDAASLLQMIDAHSLQDAQYAHCIHIGGELRCIEAHLYVALCCQIVYLCGHHLTYQLDQRHGVTHVGIVEVEVGLSL